MRDPKPAHRRVLTPEEAERLRQLIRAQSTAQALVVWAQIVLAAYEHPEWST